MMITFASRTLKRTECLAECEAPVIDSLCSTILHRFRQMDECPDDWPIDWAQVGATQVRRGSTIYRLRSPKCALSICIKISRKLDHSAQESVNLYAALSHYHSRADHENGYTVPRPYGLIAEYDAVIMEWVDGRTFGEILKNEFFFTKRRHENIQKAARWLRWFHDQSDVKSKPLSDGWSLNYIVKTFEESRDLLPAAKTHDPALKRQLDLAVKKAAEHGGTEIEYVVLHGDFKATNLLISKSGTVVGIDFLGSKRGPISQDICRFLSDLDFYRNLTGQTYALKSGSRSNDFEAFLTGYGHRAGGIAKTSFVYLYFLTILSALVHQRRKFKHGTKHRIRMSVFRSIAKQLAHELRNPGVAVISCRNRIQFISIPQIKSLRLPTLHFPVDWAIAFWESEMIWSVM